MTAGGRGKWIFLAESFFLFLLFYQCNNINTRYRQFILLLTLILAHSSFCYILMRFSSLLKSALFPTPNVSPPTVFDLGGWNRHYFVGNWVAEIVIYHFFNIRSISSKNMQHQKKCKKYDFLKKTFHLLLQCLLFRNSKKWYVKLCA